MIDAPRERVFALAAGEDVPAIFQKHGPFPGAVRFDGAREWRAVGDRRTIHLSDGTHLNEELTEIDPAARFVYRASGFEGPSGALIAQATGDWRFFDENGGTRVSWTYSFAPKLVFAAPPVAFIARALWPGYMRAALRRLKEAAETGT